MGRIKNYLKIFYRKNSFLAKKLHFSNVLNIVTSRLILLILFANLFLLTACEDEVTQPTPKPPGYQEDIPWPSLADSPWPMDHHDPQNTGRSQFYGPHLGEIEWIADSMVIKNSIAIGSDSTIYVAIGGGSVYNQYKPGLYALNPKGETKWVFYFPDVSGSSFSTPLVASDGTIYCSFNGYLNKKFFAVNPDGSLKWELDNIDLKMTAINIGLDGTLYFIQSGGILTALSKYGNILWTYTDSRFYGGDNSGLSISPDGNILYLLAYIDEGWLTAFNIESKSIIWNFGDNISGHPAVDSDGNVYVIANVDSVFQGITSLYSISKEGKIRWMQPMFSAVSYLYNSNPIIDKNGNIYCGYDTLFSFDYSGNLRWKIDLCSSCQDPFGFIVSPLICSSEGIIYASISDNDNHQLKEIIAISSEGNLIWKIILNDSPLPGGGFSPAIGYNNEIYYPTEDVYKLLKIK